MQKIKRLIAGLITSGLILSCLALAGCAPDTTYSMKYGEKIVKPGVYILCQFDARMEAENLFIERNPGVDTTVEGFDYGDYKLDDINFFDWVSNRALELTAEILYIDDVFKEKELSLTSEETKKLRDAADYEWDLDVFAMYGYTSGKTRGELYTEEGISKDSFRTYYISRQKENLVFDSVYGENGTNPVPESEWQEVWQKDYARIRLIEISVQDENGEDVSEETLAELEALGASYVDALNSGGSFASVSEDYYNYKNGIVKEDEEEPEELETYEDDELFDEFLSAESSYQNEELVKEIFSMDVDTVELFKTEAAYFVIQKLNVLDREDLYENYRETIIHKLKDEEFKAANQVKAQEMLKTKLDVNQAAVERYNPKKLG